MDDLAALIERAHGDMYDYQRRLRRDPALAQVSIGNLSHVLVPTHVMARELPEALDAIVGAETAAPVIYRFGWLIGRTQAGAFFADRGLDEHDVRYRVLTGPFHLAWAGYGDVDLLVWEPHLDERFAVLWESENSFSALEAGREQERTRACHLQAGYSAGWCTEATGIRLDTRELACRAEGVARCRFLIGQADMMDTHLADPRFHKATRRYSVRPVRTRTPRLEGAA